VRGRDGPFWTAYCIGGNAPDAALDYLALNRRMGNGPFGSPRWYPVGSEQHYADVVPVGSFYNGLWRCEDIVDVLNQFDFTCNAVALDVRTGCFFDPQNGLRALRRRVMQAVRFDYPDEPILKGHRLTRNAVVWFRILHYAAARHLSIEPVTLEWLRSHCAYQTKAAEFESVFFRLDPNYVKPIE
jgi:hypothetical protein